MLFVAVLFDGTVNYPSSEVLVPILVVDYVADVDAFEFTISGEVDPDSVYLGILPIKWFLTVSSAIDVVQDPLNVV